MFLTCHKLLKNIKILCCSAQLLLTWWATTNSDGTWKAKPSTRVSRVNWGGGNLESWGGVTYSKGPPDLRAVLHWLPGWSLLARLLVMDGIRSPSQGHLPRICLLSDQLRTVLQRLKTILEQNVTEYMWIHWNCGSAKAKLSTDAGKERRTAIVYRWPIDGPSRSCHCIPIRKLTRLDSIWFVFSFLLSAVFFLFLFIFIFRRLQISFQFLNNFPIFHLIFKINTYLLDRTHFLQTFLILFQLTHHQHNFPL